MPNIPQAVIGTEREEWLLADYLIRSVVGKASGQNESECTLNLPKDVYFIGNLRPRNEQEESLSRADLMQKLAPSALGVEFKLQTESSSVSIDVDIKWSCYYRVFPTYQQQFNWMRHVVQAHEDSGEEDNDRRRDDLMIRFKKINCFASGKINLTKNGGEWNANLNDLNTQIQQEIERAYAEVNADPERLRLRTVGQLFTIPVDVIESEANYFRFIGLLSVNPQINWNLTVQPEIHRLDQHNQFIFFLQIVNSSVYAESDKTVESYLFNPIISATLPINTLIPFEMELAPKNFRYDKNLWGRGFNCGLNKEGDSYVTTNTPTYTQFRYKTQVEADATFANLASDPIPVLEKILKSMTSYLTEWDAQAERFSQMYGAIWNTHYSHEYQNDRLKFEQEIELYSKGLHSIKTDKDIDLAFKLTNEAFRITGLDHNGNILKDKWRLFQIVFMVCQIPGMAALNPDLRETYGAERDFVDIVYFPTGGGKTEAYLSVLVFHCFYDRLRGKTAGVTSWIRFPLRLLTLQQTQRLADIIGVADIVRREHGDARLSGKTVHQFAVGYYVGGGEGSTPNEIKRIHSGSPDPIWAMALDQFERQKWKRIVSCPSCKTKTISVEFDQQSVRIIHKCSNKACKFPNGTVPVYVIDNEIYRYLPSVMVGTIDKLAGIGIARKLSLVFGKLDGYCKVHGFYNGNCCQKECTDKAQLVRQNFFGLTGPTLFIQDELHLLKEGLGTFDSHYETFVQYLLAEAGMTSSLKIIASSATIEQYERQVEHLYGRPRSCARVFPGVGPTLQSSFYAITEKYPQRIFVGILPHNKTIFNSILELIEYYHRVTQHLVVQTSNVYSGALVPGTRQWNEKLDLYYTSLTYFLASRELDSIKSDIESHINGTKFSNEGLNQLTTKELTGGTSTDNISTILERLQTPHRPDESHEAVLATNMISHGVDVDRFNSMIFYGMPRQTAEYIQASSRVGRSHVGIVFNCMHPIRERDQSHYSYFSKYHEFLGQMVEPVAINRWSAYGIDKTLPGLFMATLLQILSNRDQTGNRNSYYMLDRISKLYQQGGIDTAEIKQILVEAFRARIPNDTRNQRVIEKIERSVDFYFQGILAGGSGNDFVSSALHPLPMRSLRDIDEPIEISINNVGEQWANTN